VPHPLVVIDTGPEIGWLQFHGKGLYVHTDIWRGHPSTGIIPKQRQAYVYIECPRNRQLVAHVTNARPGKIKWQWAHKQRRQKHRARYGMASKIAFK